MSTNPLILTLLIALSITLTPGFSSANFFRDPRSIPPTFNATPGAWDGFHNFSGCHAGQRVDGLSKLKSYFHNFGYILTSPIGNFSDEYQSRSERGTKWATVPNLSSEMIFYIRDKGQLQEFIYNCNMNIRDHNGKIINMNKGSIFEKGAIQVEARALLAGIKKARELGISKLIIEVDNLTIINTLNGRWKPPWEIPMIIEDIRLLLHQFTICNIFHCYREGNQAADFIAKNNCNFNFNYNNLDSRSREFFVIIQKDELGWSFVRKTT